MGMNQRLANESNEKIANENNATQMQMWREQQQHDLNMWNLENQYNDPVAQMKRLEAAGLNPFMLASGAQAGNATGNAGGQTPPQLTSAVMQPMQNPSEMLAQLAAGVQSFAGALRQGKENSILSIQSDWFKQLSLQGINPEEIKAGVLLQEYRNMQKTGKYIQPHMEAVINNLGSSTRVNDAVVKVREEEAKKIKTEAEYLGIQKDFDSQRFPKELEKLTNEIKIAWEQHQKNMDIGDSVVALNRANASQADAATSFINQQEQTEYEKTVQEQFKAGLAKLGINPSSSNLPFFAGIALNMLQGKIKPYEVAQYFELLTTAENLGVHNLSKSDKNLSIFELWNRPSGVLGSGINVNTMTSDGDFLKFFEKLGIGPIRK